DGPVGVDLIDQVMGAAPTEPLELLEIVDPQRVEVDRARQQPGVDRLADHLGAEALDVDGLGEVLELAEPGRDALLGLRAEQELTLPLLATDRLAVAGRAARGDLVLLPAGPRRDGPLDVRDHAAAPRDLDGRALGQAELLEAVEVEQPGAPDHRPRQLDRLEDGDRGDGPGPADRPQHVLERGGPGVALELVGDRPARVMAGLAEPLLLA